MIRLCSSFFSLDLFSTLKLQLFFFFDRCVCFLVGALFFILPSWLCHFVDSARERRITLRWKQKHIQMYTKSRAFCHPQFSTHLSIFFIYLFFLSDSFFFSPTNFSFSFLSNRRLLFGWLRLSSFYARIASPGCDGKWCLIKLPRAIISCVYREREGYSEKSTKKYKNEENLYHEIFILLYLYFLVVVVVAGFFPSFFFFKFQTGKREKERERGEEMKKGKPYNTLDLHWK